MVRGVEKDGKRVYELTSKGEEAVVGIVDESRVFLDYLANLKSLQAVPALI